MNADRGITLFLIRIDIPFCQNIQSAINKIIFAWHLQEGYFLPRKEGSLLGYQFSEHRIDLFGLFPFCGRYKDISVELLISFFGMTYSD